MENIFDTRAFDYMIFDSKIAFNLFRESIVWTYAMENFFESQAFKHIQSETISTLKRLSVFDGQLFRNSCVWKYLIRKLHSIFFHTREHIYYSMVNFFNIRAFEHVRNIFRAFEHIRKNTFFTHECLSIFDSESVLNIFDTRAFEHIRWETFSTLKCLNIFDKKLLRLSSVSSYSMENFSDTRTFDYIRYKFFPHSIVSSTRSHIQWNNFLTLEGLIILKSY